MLDDEDFGLFKDVTNKGEGQAPPRVIMDRLYDILDEKFEYDVHRRKLEAKRLKENYQQTVDPDDILPKDKSRKKKKSKEVDAVFEKAIYDAGKKDIVSVLSQFKSHEAKMNRYAFHRALTRVSKDHPDLLKYELASDFDPKFCIKDASTYNSEGTLIKSLTDEGIECRVEEFEAFITKKLKRWKAKDKNFSEEVLSGKDLSIAGKSEFHVSVSLITLSELITSAEIETNIFDFCFS